ncbi:Cytochrome P [Trema orientale]|uniref:Cytochrome P n=1 Tax=Trema orientale TaxID=63057 RepID=A0A2P5BXT3_TREOI|nr:Cytochrome P [Trema orientale]
MREIYSGTWPFAITTLFFLLFLAKFLRNKNKNVPKTSYKLPPGRRGWPLIGDSFSWYNAVASSHPPRFVEEQVKRFGKIFSCSLFGKWAVVSADPFFNRFVMQNEGKLFKSSYPKSFRDLVGKNGVITVQGEQQRKLHGIASNMMRLEKLKFHFLEDIQRVMTQTLGGFQDNQVAIHLMVNQLLGVTSESEINEMAQLFSDFVDGCLSVPINLPGCPYHTAMKVRQLYIV